MFGCKYFSCLSHPEDLESSVQIIISNPRGMNSGPLDHAELWRRGRGCKPLAACSVLFEDLSNSHFINPAATFWKVMQGPAGQHNWTGVWALDHFICSELSLHCWVCSLAEFHSRHLQWRCPQGSLSLILEYSAKLPSRCFLDFLITWTLNSYTAREKSLLKKTQDHSPFCTALKNKKKKVTVWHN